jgi:hypothetical protein
MAICIVFMTNTQLAKKRWEVLVVYTMTILFLKYFWVLLIPFTAETDSNERIYQIVGLPTLIRTLRTSTAIFLRTTWFGFCSSVRSCS